MKNLYSKIDPGVKAAIAVLIDIGTHDEVY